MVRTAAVDSCPSSARTPRIPLRRSWRRRLGCGRLAPALAAGARSLWLRLRRLLRRSPTPRRGAGSRPDGGR